MATVDLLDAETRLSSLVNAVESGAEAEIIIARNGKPAAKLVPISKTGAIGKRLGLLAGKFPVVSQVDFDGDNEAIGAIVRGDSHEAAAG